MEQSDKKFRNIIIVLIVSLLFVLVISNLILIFKYFDLQSTIQVLSNNISSQQISNNNKSRNVRKLHRCYVDDDGNLYTFDEDDLDDDEDDNIDEQEVDSGREQVNASNVKSTNESSKSDSQKNKKHNSKAKVNSSPASNSSDSAVVTSNSNSSGKPGKSSKKKKKRKIRYIEQPNEFKPKEEEPNKAPTPPPENPSSSEEPPREVQKPNEPPMVEESQKEAPQETRTIVVEDPPQVPENYCTNIELVPEKSDSKVNFDVSNMLPGDVEVKRYNLKVSHEGDCTLKYSADAKSDKLAEVLKCKVDLVSAGETLFDGFVKDMPVAFDRKIAANDSHIDDLIYEITASLDENVGNDYQMQNAVLDFRWDIYDTYPEPQPTVHTEIIPVQGEIPEEPIDLPVEVEETPIEPSAPVIPVVPSIPIIEEKILEIPIEVEDVPRLFNSPCTGNDSRGKLYIVASSVSLLGFILAWLESLRKCRAGKLSKCPRHMLKRSEKKPKHML